MRRRSTQPQPTVVMEHIPAPDAPERLAKAYQLLVRAAARAEEQGAAHEGAPIQNTEQEAENDE